MPSRSWVLNTVQWTLFIIIWSTKLSDKQRRTHCSNARKFRQSISLSLISWKLPFFMTLNSAFITSFNLCGSSSSDAIKLLVSTGYTRLVDKLMSTKPQFVSKTRWIAISISSCSRANELDMFIWEFSYKAEALPSFPQSINARATGDSLGSVLAFPKFAIGKTLWSLFKVLSISHTASLENLQHWCSKASTVHHKLIHAKNVAMFVNKTKVAQKPSTHSAIQLTKCEEKSLKLSRCSGRSEAFRILYVRIVVDQLF